jgi:hypothetical protein
LNENSESKIAISGSCQVMLWYMLQPIVIENRNTIIPANYRVAVEQILQLEGETGAIIALPGERSGLMICRNNMKTPYNREAVEGTLKKVGLRGFVWVDIGISG